MDTKTRILDAAERLTQVRGINGFSYLHLADELEIKTSSIHYHFKTKADLALALVDRVNSTHFAYFYGLAESVPDPAARLQLLVEFFEDYVRQGKFCMCGMMSAEMQFVSEATVERLQEYFGNLRAWVAIQLQELGVADPEGRALQFVSVLEGSLLLARLHKDPSLVQRALAGLTQ